MLIVSKTYSITYELAVGGGGGSGSLEAPDRGAHTLVKEVI